MTMEQLALFPIALVLLALGNLWLSNYQKTRETEPMNWKGGRNQYNIV